MTENSIKTCEQKKSLTIKLPRTQLESSVNSDAVMVLIPQAVVRVYSQNTAHWLEICHHIGLMAMKRFEEILWSEKFSLLSDGVSVS